jgi:hypothetical protein
MTNASLGLRLTHVYHNCFYTSFTSAIRLTVNIGLDGGMRQSRHFTEVNQRNKFDHNHGVSARNDFADNPARFTLEYGKRDARASRPRQASDCIRRSLGRSHLRICRLWPMIESPRQNAPSHRREITGSISPRLPLGRNSSFGPSGKSDIDWFRADDPQFRPAPCVSTAGRRAQRLPLRGILIATPVDMSKRRIRGRRPANKAAQLPAFSLRLPARITYEACHRCVVKTS